MQKKIAAALLLSSALLAPAAASADGSLFPNRGACESALKQLRNTLRQDVVREVFRPAGQQGPAGAATNRLANPAIKQFCQAVTGQDGKTLGFKIVEG